MGEYVIDPIGVTAENGVLHNVTKSCDRMQETLDLMDFGLGHPGGYLSSLPEKESAVYISAHCAKKNI